MTVVVDDPKAPLQEVLHRGIGEGATHLLGSFHLRGLLDGNQSKRKIIKNSNLFNSA